MEEININGYKIPIMCKHGNCKEPPSAQEIAKKQQEEADRKQRIQDQQDQLDTFRYWLENLDPDDPLNQIL